MKGYIDYTKHAEKRMSQRGITPAQVGLCIDFGKTIMKTGFTYYVMTKKCLQNLKKELGVYAEKLEGITVIADLNQDMIVKVITAYKDSNSVLKINKQCQHRLK